MSKIKIVGHASGSGVLTIAAPNTNTDRTITIPDVTGTLLDSGSDLPAANLTGTVADARFPATLPAKSGVNLTALNATELTSGTIPIARIADDAVTNAKMADDAIDSAQIAAGAVDDAHLATGISASKLTGALPAISGASLTNLPPSGGSITATADGAISANQTVILQTNATVKAVAGSTVSEAVPEGTASTFDGNASIDVIGFDLDPVTAGKGVIGYRDGSNYKARVFTSSGSTITYGSEQTLTAVSNGFRGDNQCLAYVAQDKFVISYIKNGNSQNNTTRGMARVCTISGTTITAGSEAEPNSSYTNGLLIAGDPVNSTCVIFWVDGNGGYSPKTQAATVSGTSFSWGSEHSMGGGNANTWGLDLYNNRVIITYKDHDASYVGKMKAGTLSGNSITWGPGVTYDSYTHPRNSSVAINPNNSNEAIVAMQDRDNSDYGALKIVTISTNTISLGNIINFKSAAIGGNPLCAWNKNSEDKIAIAYVNESNSNTSPGKCAIVIGTVSGASISFGSEIDIANSEGYRCTQSQIHFDNSSSGSDRFAFIYNDNNNYSKVVWSRMGGASSTNLTATNFLGFSDAAYSDTATATILTNGAISTQSSLTTLSKYYVQTNGTLSTSAATPSVLAGQAMSTTKLLIKEEI